MAVPCSPSSAPVLEQVSDMVQEMNGLPDFLQSLAAEKWLCEAAAQLRYKGCGIEEIAWILGIPVKVLNDALPSSASPEFVGTNLLDLGFLPRGAGCMIANSRSAAYLNGRKCTLVMDCADGVEHAHVLVEGGPGEEMGQEDAAKPIMIARKNLTFAAEPAKTGMDGWPSVNLVPSENDNYVVPEEFKLELLGDVVLGLFQSSEAELWLATVVAKIVQTKQTGQEELGYILGLPEPGSSAGFGGTKVPRTIVPENFGEMLEELGFVPKGSRCVVEGSRSCAHLNGRVCTLKEACLDSTMHAQIFLGPDEGQLQIHRKNLRLLDPTTLKGVKDGNFLVPPTAGGSPADTAACGTSSCTAGGSPADAVLNRNTVLANPQDGGEAPAAVQATSARSVVDTPATAPAAVVTAKTGGETPPAAVTTKIAAEPVAAKPSSIWDFFFSCQSCTICKAEKIPTSTRASPRPAPAPVAATADIPAQLSQLNLLRQQGILSEEEFLQAKARVLS